MSAVLSGNFSTFTPGISEYNALGSRFYLADASGNSRGLLNSSGAATDGYNWDAFGTLISRAGSNPTMFAWNEASGYQTDNDDGLTLLGHRYYDKRTGRFISQDPIRDGGNWYAYCDNNPTNLKDALGLTCAPFDSTGMTEGDIYDYVTSHGGEVGEEYQTTNAKGTPVYDFTVAGFSYGGVSIVGPQGSNINNDIARARQFYQSDASRDWRGIGHGQKVFTHDPKKVGDWLINNYGPGTEGDPKKYGKQYDKYGHAIYAAASSEVQVTLPTILEGEVSVHDAVHPLSPGEEENGEYAGWGYDQHLNHPGPGIWTDSDFIPSAAGFAWQYAWQRLTGG